MNSILLHLVSNRFGIPMDVQPPGTVRDLHSPRTPGAAQGPSPRDAKTPT